MATSAKFKVNWWGQDPYEGAEPDALVIAAALAGLRAGLSNLGGKSRLDGGPDRIRTCDNTEN